MPKLRQALPILYVFINFDRPESIRENSKESVSHKALKRLSFSSNPDVANIFESFINEIASHETQRELSNIMREVVLLNCPMRSLEPRWSRFVKPSSFFDPIRIFNPVFSRILVEAQQHQELQNLFGSIIEAIEVLTNFLGKTLQDLVQSIDMLLLIGELHDQIRQHLKSLKDR